MISTLRGKWSVRRLGLMMVMLVMGGASLAQESWRFDFQPQGAPVASGFEAVTRAETYSPERGYGWLQTPAFDRERSAGNDLSRDFVAGPAESTFRVAVPNGDYTITLQIGDMGIYSHDYIRVASGASVLIDRLDCPAGESFSIKGGATVSDGYLDLTISDEGGSDANWVWAGVEIEAGTYTGPIYEYEWPQPEVRERYVSEYGVFSEDGAWCWFADPRATWHEGRLYLGWITSNGSIVVSNYEPETGVIRYATIHDRLERDDHDNPSLQFLPDGRLLVFYSKHFDPVMRMRVCSNPAELSDWDETRELDLTEEAATGNPLFTYPNPAILSDEGNRLYLFWRGWNWKPNWAWSDDNGETWTRAGTVISREGAGSNNRPYVKMVSDGKSRIHLLFTDGHPRNEPTNSIYHAYYEDGAWHRADGTRIATNAELPFEPSEADLIYDGSGANGRGWVWDVALDGDGHPVAVYMTAPTEDDHRYRYARWNGSEWVDSEMVKAGGWFPQTPPGANESEPHYSGGIVLDHADPSTVYLSRDIDGVFEIERWQTTDDGATWTREALTENSVANNVRPVVTRKPGEREPAVFWMYGAYIHYTNYRTLIRTNLESRTPQGELIDQQAAPDVEATLDIMRRVLDWQLDEIRREDGSFAPDRGWVRGALDTGVMAGWRVLGDAKYYQAAVAMAEANGWELGNRVRHADDHVVGQMYAELYEVEREAERLADMHETLQYLMENPRPGREDYWWCDALFMAPPAWVRLGALADRPDYIDFVDGLFWDSTEYLYDTEQHLYYRDNNYFDATEANGQSVFWSRGNGWVIGGIARLLQYLPEDHASREMYETLFREMAAKLLELQPADGLWRPSLLFPEGYLYGETSGSGFFCFALAWGINEGLLDRATYEPAVQKSWRALCASVHEDGKLGFVQQIGASPAPTSYESTQEYGVGAFLLAGEQVLQLMGHEPSPPSTGESAVAQGWAESFTN